MVVEPNHMTRPLANESPPIWMIESRKAPGRSETNGTPFCSSRSSGEFLVPKMRNLGGLVTGEDAGQHEPPYSSLAGHVNQVAVTDRVDHRRIALAVAGVAGRRGDHRIRAVHHPQQGRRLHHVAPSDLHPGLR